MLSESVLKGFELFNGLDDSQLSEIAKLCHIHTLEEDHLIFKEGNRAENIHLCRSGKVDITIWTREPWNKSIVVHRVGQGELFGWSALVAPYTYTASAECVELGEEIRITGHELLNMMDKHPSVGYRIMTNLDTDISARLMQTRKKLSMEWLAAGSVTSPGSSTWGESGRR